MTRQDTGRDAAVGTTESLQPATVGGLAAAVMSHLPPGSTRYTGGAGNASERWRDVGFEVTAAHETVPVDVMVQKQTTDIDPARLGTCPEKPTDPGLLSCRVDKAADGTRLGVATSTEDIVGGISRHGFFVYVLHPRSDHVVLVTEELARREKAWLDLTALPVPLEVLEAIAGDPLVGTRTSAELNRTGHTLDPQRGL